MLFGVICFSYATSILSSLLQNLDSSQAAYLEKMMVLNEMKEQYGMDEHLYHKLRVAIKFDCQKNKKDTTKFV